ncbi:AraC-like DNA-binding protein [Rhodococcus sp. 27YEA15]|uniref:helix-turn-helix domain-containing protein n=1 Tax=Rhodococcus sp. 27YEA15 TaxID=3156259 RepID=UPI003C7B0861
MRRSESIAVERVIHTIDHPVWIVDGVGGIVTINRSALSTMGYGDDKSLVGQNCHTLFHHSHLDGSDYHQSDCPLFHRTRQDHSATAARRGTEWFIRRTGTVVPIAWSTTTLEVDSATLTMISLDVLAHQPSTVIPGTGRQARQSVLDRKQIYHRACRMIAATSDDPELTPARIATRLHVSLRYLQVAFAEADDSPARRIRHVRLDRALCLLESGFGAAEAGEQAGFSDPTTFRRLFRRRFDTNPAQRRRR